MLDKIFQKYITAKNIIFFIISILLIIFITKIKDIAIMFFAAYVIACSLEPMIQKLEKKFSRSVASVIVLSASILIVFAVFIPIVVLGGNEIRHFAISFPIYMETLKEFIISNSFLSRSTLSQIDIGGIITSASGITTNIISETINLGKNVGSAFLYLLVSTIIIYYFMVDKYLIRKTVLRLFPVYMRKKSDDIMNTIAKKIGGYVIALIITMASVGIIMTLGLLLLRVDYALLLGLITSVLDIIPVAGPTVALIICLIATCKSGFGIMLLVALIFAIAQLVENNFVRPYVFSKFLDLHPLIIFLFLFITAKYMGIVGVVFAPAIAATAVVLIEELYMKNLE